MRVVIDTNVVVSRLLIPLGPPARIMKHYEQGLFELLVSGDILAEYRRTLGYNRLRVLHHMNDSEIDAFMEDLGEFSTLVEPNIKLDVVKEDPKDNKFIECALAGEADFIVSGDAPLLNLGEYQGIQVLSPATFLRMLEQA